MTANTNIHVASYRITAHNHMLQLWLRLIGVPLLHKQHLKHECKCECQ